ncbi:MAG: hypothetical protein AABX30_01545 [Nanoarchaeota archaeon]
MNYRDAIKSSMEMLSQEDKSIFLGYNVAFGSKGYGTFNNISSKKLLETPLAENLMMGLGIGMALEGYKPLIFFERHDFILNALDSIVNHADKLNKLSNGQYNLSLIIRATIGASKPLNPGPQHTQDFTEVFKSLMTFPIYIPKTPLEILGAYKVARDINRPIMVIERRDLYDIQ